MTAALDVLFVCTANQCRSPMAETLLRARAPSLRVASSGTRAVGSAAMSAGASTALRELGLTVEPHASRALDRSLVDAASLVIGLARMHVREAAVLAPASFWKVFTLKELVRRGASVGARGADESLESWLRRVGAGRSVGSLMGDDPADDVADPIGGPASGYAACARELSALVDSLVDLAFST